MSHSQAGAVGGRALFVGLSKNKSLTYLDVSSSQLTGYWTEHGSEAYDENVVNAISEALSMNKTIEYVDLRDNCLFGLALVKHKATEDSNVCTEGTFSLSSLDNLTAAIAMNAENNGKLKYLDISRNRISVNDCLCKFCAQSPTERVGLGGGHCKRYYATRPKASVQDCPQNCALLRSLQLLIDVRANHPTLRSICGMTTFVTHMHFSGVRLCDHWCALLASELKYTHTLTSLDISNNVLTARGARTLAAGIAENISLKYIVLPSCRFLSDFGAHEKEAHYARQSKFVGM